MSFTLPALPFAADAFSGLISANTFSFHHGKHHNAYVTNLNNLVNGTEFAGLGLEEVILKSKSGPIFNNAAQHFNHSFFWNSLKPNGGGVPTGEVAAAIVRDFGSFDSFKDQFHKTAATHFGSGWAWLVLNKDKKLEVVGTHDAETPLTAGKTPILTIDVWEHAYYLDYQNRRPDFVTDFLGKMANWDFANENYKKASAKL